MEKIDVLIVEDNALTAEFISTKLKEHNLEVAGVYRTGEETLASLENRLPDLILMDIELAGALDGIATAKLINEKYALPIIYLTDFSDSKTVDRAKKTFPASYITKPFNEVDLIRSIDVAFYNASALKNRSRPSMLQDFLFIRVDNQAYQKLSYDEILFLKADRAYCHLVTENKTYTLSTSMNHVQDQINHKDFIKVHRSHVINLNKITAIEGRTLRIGEHHIQMNEEMHEELMSRFKMIK